MRLGLLAGLGAGLSQGAQLLNQGMQEDRNARREAEREARREAIEAAREKAAESRWRESFEFQKQQAKEQREYQNQRAAVEDQRYKDNKEYQLNRDKVTDGRYASDKISRQIEGEMERSYKEMREEMRTVAGQYDSTISALRKERETLIRVKDSADPMGLGEQTSVRSPAEIKNRLEYIDTQLEKLQGERKSTMAEMRSESLKRLQGIAGAYDPSIIESSSFKGYMQAAGQELATFTNPDTPVPGGKDAPGNDATAIAGTLGGNSAMAQAVGRASDDQGKVEQGQTGFGFIPGLTAGYKAATANNGQGLLTNLMEQNSQYSPEHTSLLGHILHPASSLVGTAAGIGTSAIGSVIDAGRAITETPAERQKRLSKQQGR